MFRENILKSGAHNKMTLREYSDCTIWGGTGRGGGVDNKIEGAMIFIFLLLPEMVDTLILLLELMCFL